MKRVFWYLLSLGLVLGLFVGAELFVARHFATTPFDNTFMKKIVAERPELIMIGNSTLGTNINKGVLTEELSTLLGRPIRVTFINKGGTHGAWQYLVFKNQVVPSGTSKIPVVFVDYEDYFVQPLAGTQSGGRTEEVLKATMTNNEPELYAKLKQGKIYFLRGFPHLYSERYQIKRALTASLLFRLADWTQLDKLFPPKRWSNRREYPVHAVSWAFGKLFKSTYFRSGQPAPLEAEFNPSLEFSQLVENSFLPDILKFRDNYHIAFLLSSTNPGLVGLKASVLRFSAEAQKYFTSIRVPFIDMNHVAVLQDSALMHDSRHFNKGEAITLNSREVARALVSQGVVK